MAGAAAVCLGVKAKQAEQRPCDLFSACSLYFERREPLHRSAYSQKKLQTLLFIQTSGTAQVSVASQE